MIARAQLKDPELLGAVLQQGRLQKGFSQRELAAQLGVSQKWVWEMEQGKPGLLMERLFRMLQATDVKLYAEIETGTGDPR
ncbi:MAG: helix-turn-helix domain-containing protein [Actinomycetia bacterium]|nr:helix-turn-helix domain-containing protein [Actinomycetes bacterium]